MKVAVLGAGVIGVATAYYLARAGHQVVVLDRRDGPAQETSFANAGEISPGYAAPWAAPGVPLKALRWLLMEHAPLILHAPTDLATLAWLGATLRNCTAARYARNKARMVRLAEYSRLALQALRADLGLAYDQRAKGTLQLFRTPAQLDRAAQDIAVLRDFGVAFELLDAAGCIGVEPGLAHAEARFVGGLRLPDDETGDCYLFTVALADHAARLGVEFRYATRILGLQRDGERISAAVTDRGPLEADAVVVATGSYAPALLGPLGLPTPVCPVKGYSITAPVVSPEQAPESTLMDETFKVAITRLGDRIRVGGMAELAGFDLSLPDARRHTLEHSLRSLFPRAGDVAAAQFWTGLRPMTPDGTPFVGPTPIRNLFLNTGHGTLGWTMACGSGRLIADLISGIEPDIESGDLSLARDRA